MPDEFQALPEDAAEEAVGPALGGTVNPDLPMAFKDQDGSRVFIVRKRGGPPAPAPAQAAAPAIDPSVPSTFTDADGSRYFFVPKAKRASTAPPTPPVSTEQAHARDTWPMPQRGNLAEAREVSGALKVQPPPERPTIQGQPWSVAGDLAAAVPGALFAPIREAEHTLGGEPETALLNEPITRAPGILAQTGQVQPSTLMAGTEPKVSFPPVPLGTNREILENAQYAPVVTTSGTPQTLRDLVAQQFTGPKWQKGVPSVVAGTAAAVGGAADMFADPSMAAIVFGLPPVTEAVGSIAAARFGPTVGKALTSALAKGTTGAFAYQIAKNLSTERMQQLGEAYADNDPKGLAEGIVGGAIDAGFLKNLIPGAVRGLPADIGTIAEKAGEVPVSAEAKANLAQLRAANPQTISAPERFDTRIEAMDAAQKFYGGATVRKIGTMWQVEPTNVPIEEGGRPPLPGAIGVGKPTQQQEGLAVTPPAGFDYERTLGGPGGIQERPGPAVPLTQTGVPIEMPGAAPPRQAVLAVQAPSEATIPPVQPSAAPVPPTGAMAPPPPVQPVAPPQGPPVAPPAPPKPPTPAQIALETEVRRLAAQKASLEQAVAMAKQAGNPVEYELAKARRKVAAKQFDEAVKRQMAPEPEKPVPAAAEPPKKTMPEIITAPPVEAPAPLPAEMPPPSPTLAETAPPAERPAGPFQPRIVGPEDVVETPTGQPIPFRYAVVEAREPLTSHDIEGNPRPGYAVPGEVLQGRDRADEKSIVQMNKIKSDPRLRLLSASPTVETGAPLIGPDGRAITNGRLEGLATAYETGTAGKYRAGLPGELRKLGFPDDQIAATEGMKAPVLIRMMNPEAQVTTRLARDTNVSSGLTMGAAERGRQDAAMMMSPAERTRTEALLGQYAPNDAGDLTTPSNRPFSYSYAQNFVPENERGGMFREGDLSPDGATRIRGALVAAAYGDSPVVDRLLEGGGSETGTLRGALVNAAPALAKVRLGQTMGELERVDVAKPIVEAADFLNNIRADGKTLESVLRPKYGELLPATDTLSPEALDLLKFFDANKGRGGEKKITALLQEIARQAEGVRVVETEGGIFAPEEMAALKQEPPSVAELIDAAKRNYDADLFSETDQAMGGGRAAEGGEVAAGPSEAPAEPVAPARGKPGGRAAAPEPDLLPPPEPERTVPVEGAPPLFEIPEPKGPVGAVPPVSGESLGAAGTAAPMASGVGPIFAPQLGARIRDTVYNTSLPKKNISLMARIKDIFGGSGLNQADFVAPEAAVATHKASSASQQARQTLEDFYLRAGDVLAGKDASAEEKNGAVGTFSTFLTWNRLKGIQDKWKAVYDDYANMTSGPLLSDDGLSFSKMIARSVEGRRGFPSEDADEQPTRWNDLEAQVDDLADKKDAGGLRRLMTDIARNAYENVGTARLPNDEGFDQYAARPEVKQAVDYYKENVEPHLRKAHLANEGYLSTFMGPLDTYYPLVATDANAGFRGTGKREQLQKPRNPGNYFATGLGEYDTGREAFRQNLKRAIRQNEGAHAIQLFVDAGAFRELKKGEVAPDTMTLAGKEVPAHAYPAGPRYALLGPRGLKTLPQKQILVPDILYNEVKHVLFLPERVEKGAWNAITNAITVTNLGGPTDAVFHTMNEVGTLMLRVPFVGTDIASKLAGSLPIPVAREILRPLALGINLMYANPMKSWNVERLHDLIRLGVIPPRQGSSTYSRKWAEQTGAEYSGWGPIPILRKPWKYNERGEWRPQFPGDFGPIIYGPKGLDIRARILIDKLGEDMATRSAKRAGVPLDTVWNDRARIKWNQMLGNYNLETEGRMMRALKTSGLAPFATAGITMNINGVIGMMAGGKLPVAGSQIFNAYRATMLSNLVLGNVLSWMVANKLYHDKWPWEMDDASLGQITLKPEDRASWMGRQVYGDDLTKTGKVNLWAENPLLSRGLRITGIKGAVEGALDKVPETRRVDQSLADIYSGAIHPAIGPAAHLFAKGASGLDLAFEPKPGGGVGLRSAIRGPVLGGWRGAGQRAMTGLVSANPIARRIIEAKQQEQPAGRFLIDTFAPGVAKGPYKLDSPLQREAFQYWVSKKGVLTEQEQKNYTAQKMLRELFKSGDTEDARAELYKAQRGGGKEGAEITEPQARALKKQYRTPAWEAQLRTADLPTLLPMVELARPDEMGEAVKLVKAQLRTIRTKGYSEEKMDALRARANAFVTKAYATR